MIEDTNDLIELPKGEADREYLISKVRSCYELMLEMNAARDAINMNITDVHEFYKNRVDEKTKKGDVSKLVKYMASELLEGKISSDVEVKENILSLLEIVKADIVKK